MIKSFSDLAEVDQPFRRASTELRWLNVEFSSVCNLRCRWCILDHHRSRQFLPLSCFEAILKQIAAGEMPDLQRLDLHNGGETLLHPEMETALEMLARYRPVFPPNLHVALLTNGTVLSDNVLELLCGGDALDEIRVSVDGGTPQLYEHIRTGGRWNVVARNVRRISAALTASKAKTRFGIICMIPPDKPDNTGWMDPEFKAVVTLAHDLEIRHPHTWEGSLAEIDGLRANSSYKSSAKVCKFLRQNLVVLSSGEVTVCCADLNRRGVIGNVEKQKLMEVWTSSARQRMLDLWREGGFDELSLCCSCEGYYDNSEQQDIALPPRSQGDKLSLDHSKPRAIHKQPNSVPSHEILPSKLNLGCGGQVKTGYINVDRYVSAPGVIPMDIFTLPFASNSIDEILSEHMLEHLGKFEVPLALAEWARVLKRGGLLQLNLPNLEWCINEWLAKPEADRWGWQLDTIFGLQTHPGEYHKTGFTAARLRQLLTDAKFDQVEITDIWSHGQACFGIRAYRSQDADPPFRFEGGFHADEGGWRWMSGSGRLRIFKEVLPAKLALKLACQKINLYDSFPLELEVYVAGVLKDTISFNSNGQSQTVTLKLTDDTGDILIDLKSNSTFSPDQTGINSDQRKLSVRINGMKLTPLKSGLSSFAAHTPDDDFHIISGLTTDPDLSQKHKIKLQNESLQFQPQKTNIAITDTKGFSNISLEASIIIPVFNQVEYTRKCLEALRQHTREDSYEIIFIDNNSTDATKEYLCQINGNVKIVTNEENKGFTIACNQGAQVAIGKYLVFLNNDTIPLDGWLTALVNTFKLSDDIGAVGSKLIYPDMKLQEAGGIVFSDGNGWNFGKGDLADHGRYNQLVEVDYCSGASLAVRRDIFYLIGGFDEIYAPAYYEDTDLCFSIRERGYRVFYQPQSEVIHCEGKTAGISTDTGFKKYQLVNKEKFKKKWKHRLVDQGPSPYENAPKPFTADRNRRLAGYSHNKRINTFEDLPAASVNGKINFLIIDPFLPIYDRSSGSLRLFQIVKILANTPQVQVTYIARHGHHGEKYIKKLVSLGVEVYHTDPEKLFPFNILGYRHPINLKYILSQRYYHYAFLSFYEIALQYLPDIRLYSPDTRIIIDTVDIHFLREMRQAELYNDEEIKKKAINTKKNEINIYQKADALITVTEQDADIIRPYFPNKPLYVVPNIHPVEQGKKSFNKRSGIIFIGNYYHPPNIDAVEYYLQQIHPLLEQKKISISVSIIGDGLPDHVKSLAKGLKNITFVGWVPETKPYLEGARISIAPLRYGAGMKGKVGESLAAGLPIVTTTIGAEGMGLTNNQEVLIADSAEEFADMIAALYRDVNLWEKLSINGIQFIKRNYSPASVADKISKIFKIQAADTLPSCLKQSEKKEPRLTSIIIVCFNQLEYTKKCLQSIESYTTVPYELILVDNGSTDGTKEFLEKYAKKHCECNVICNDDNLGFAGGNNRGISIAKGDYILLLNNDVVVTNNWLPRLIEHIELDEGIGMVGPVSNAVSGPQQVANTSYGQNLAKMKKFAQNHRKYNASKTQDVLRLVGFCLLIKRYVLDIIGTLDESYGNGNYEDDDLCLRSRIAGFRNIIVHDVFIHHYGSMTFKGNSIDYTNSLLTNKKRFFEKWEGIVESIDDSAYRVNITTEVQLQKLLEWGEKQFLEGNLRGAVKIFGRILRLDPVNSQAINNIGVIQWKLGDPAAAIRMFQNALINNPSDENAIENLIQAIVETRKVDLIDPKLLEMIKKAQPGNQALESLLNSQ